MGQLLKEVRIINDLQILSENKNSGTMVIRGTFQRANAQNQNKRVYPKAVLESSVRRLDEKLKNRELVGELDHPAEAIVKLQNASHLITKLEWDGDDLIGEAELLPTPAGQIAKTLINAGVKIGISSRGVGTLSENSDGAKIVNDDYNMVTFDLVADPSTQGAFPSIAESKQHAIEFVDRVIKPALSEKAFLVMLEEKLNEGSRGLKRTARKISSLEKSAERDAIYDTGDRGTGKLQKSKAIRNAAIAKNDTKDHVKRTRDLHQKLKDAKNRGISKSFLGSRKVRKMTNESTVSGKGKNINTGPLINITKNKEGKMSKKWKSAKVDPHASEMLGAAGNRKAYRKTGKKELLKKAKGSVKKAKALRKKGAPVRDNLRKFKESVEFIPVRLLSEGSFGIKRTSRKAKALGRKGDSKATSAAKKAALAGLRSSVRKDKKLFTKSAADPDTVERKEKGKLKRGALRIRDRYSVNEGSAGKQRLKRVRKGLEKKIKAGGGRVKSNTDYVSKLRPQSISLRKKTEEKNKQSGKRYGQRIRGLAKDAQDQRARMARRKEIRGDK